MVKNNNKHGGDKSVIPEGIVPKRINNIQGEESSNVSTIETPKIQEVSQEAPDVPTSQKFQFTRHLQSCNNIKQGKDAWWKLQARSALISGSGKDFEPGGTVYGIKNTIDYTLDNNNAKYFNFDHVYVSNLYRTWITAFLLYGVKNTKSYDTLTLYISPYLKEYHFDEMGVEVKTGNFPKDIHHMAEKFKKFLETLHTVYSKETWYASLPSTLILKLPPSSDNKVQEIKYTKNMENPMYKLTSFCDIKDTAGPKSNKGFTETGNLQTFMEWYNSSSNYYGKNNKSGIVHIITHSHIMRDYLKHFSLNESYIIPGNAKKLKFKNKETNSFDIDKIPNNLELERIRNSNSWHFQTTEDTLKKIGNEKKSIDDYLTFFDLKAGVPNDIKQGAELEKGSANSICGASGSVKPLASGICIKNNQVGGGKKMRKKSRKTKKLSKMKGRKSRKMRK